MALADLIAAFQKDKRRFTSPRASHYLKMLQKLGWVVLIDQFEEVFTLCGEDHLREMLVRNLLYAAKFVQGQTEVIVTMAPQTFMPSARQMPN